MKKTLTALTVMLAILNIFALFTCVGAQEESDDAVEQIAHYTSEETATIDIDIENDDLFADYVNQLFYPKAKLRAPRPLSENDQAVFLYLREKIGEIANGINDNTAIVIPLSVFGIDQNMEFSADDLNVEKIFEGNAITQEADNAMGSKLQYNLNGVINQLLAVCPYELYWYDKTKAGGVKSAVSFSYSARMNGDNAVISFANDDVILVSFCVSQEYQDGSQEYIVDRVKTGAAAAALENAQNVLNENSGKSDIEKLEAYRDYITDAVTYNSDAAGNDSMAYGNPWQLIWVFDNDDSTNVVCEGYSKAFQYLCDKGFEGSSTISCDTVTGTMGGATGAGNHMWNLVTIDGVSYLADITNSDAGTVGADGSLFLAGADEYTKNGYNIKDVSYVYSDDTVEMYPPELLNISNQSYYNKNVSFVTVTWHGAGVKILTDDNTYEYDAVRKYTQNEDIYALSESDFESIPGNKIFEGWSTSETSYSIVEFYGTDGFPLIHATEDMDFYAVWTEAAEVTWNGNGGQLYDGSYDDNGNRNYGDTLTGKYKLNTYINYLPNRWEFANTPDGKAFRGWSLDKTENGIIDAWNYLITQDVELYAVWVDGAEVTWNGNGAKIATMVYDSSGNMRYSDTITERYALNTILAEAPYNNDFEDIPAGKTFLGWSLDGTENGLVDIWNYEVTSDVEFFAVWADAAVVTWNGNGAQIPDGTYNELGVPNYSNRISMIYPKNRFINPVLDERNFIDIPEGKALSGWSLDRIGNDIIDVWNYEITRDIDLYAVWVDGVKVIWNGNGAKIQTTSYDENGNQISSDKIVSYNLLNSMPNYAPSEYDFVDIPSGKEFKGWSLDGTAENIVSIWDYTITKEIEFKAVWGNRPAVDTPQNCQWTYGSTATAQWDSVEEANYYYINVKVYHNDDIVGTQTTGTSSTEIDLQSQINTICEDSDYSIVQVAFSVCAAVQSENAEEIRGDYSWISSKRNYKLKELDIPTDVSLGEDLLLSWRTVDGAEDYSYSLLITKDNELLMDGSVDNAMIYKDEFTVNGNVSSFDMSNIINKVYSQLCNYNGGGINVGDEITVSVRIKAYAYIDKGSDIDNITTDFSEYSAPITYSSENVTLLTPPQNVVIDDEWNLSWDTVDNATEYSFWIQYRREGETDYLLDGNSIPEYTEQDGIASCNILMPLQMVYHMMCQNNTINVGDKIFVKFGISARVNVGGFEADTECSEYTDSEKEYSNQDIILLDAPANVAVDGRILSWDTVNEADGYECYMLCKTGDQEKYHELGMLCAIDYPDQIDDGARMTKDMGSILMTNYSAMCAKGLISNGDVVYVKFDLYAQKTIGNGRNAYRIESSRTLSPEMVFDGQIAVESLRISPERPILHENNEYYLGYTIYPEGANYKSVIWESSNPEIVKVDSNGKISGVTKGNAVITATIDNVSCDVPVTVYEVSSNVEDAEDQKEVTYTAGIILDEIGNSDEPEISKTDIDPQNIDTIKQEIYAGLVRGDTFRTDIVMEECEWNDFIMYQNQIDQLIENGAFAGGFDINVEMFHMDNEGLKHHVGNITQFDSEIGFTIASDILAEKNPVHLRDMRLFRIHDNVLEEVSFTVNEDESVTVKSDRFSEFIFMYEKPVAMGSPDLMLPNTLQEIGVKAFEGISAKVVYIPDSCDKIDDEAFINSKVSQVRIPIGCTLGNDVFAGCEEVTIFGTKGSEAENYCSSHENCIFVEEIESGS